MVQLISLVLHLLQNDLAELLTLKIDTRIAVNHDTLSVTSMQATCFSHTDHLHALNILYLKLKMHAYIEFLRSHKLYESY